MKSDSRPGTETPASRRLGHLQYSRQGLARLNLRQGSQNDQHGFSTSGAALLGDFSERPLVVSLSLVDLGASVVSEAVSFVSVSCATSWFFRAWLRRAAATRAIITMKISQHMSVVKIRQSTMNVMQGRLE